MNDTRNTPAGTSRPWYRHLWPWLLIAIPLLSVMIASGVTLWLALAQEDTLVVEPGAYDELRRELRAQDPVNYSEEPKPDPQGDG